MECSYRNGCAASNKELASVLSGEKPLPVPSRGIPTCAVTGVLAITFSVREMVCVTLSGPVMVTVTVLVPIGVAVTGSCVGLEAHPESMPNPARNARAITSREIRFALRVNKPRPNSNVGKNTAADKMRASLPPIIGFNRD